MSILQSLANRLSRLPRRRRNRTTNARRRGRRPLAMEHLEFRRLLAAYTFTKIAAVELGPRIRVNAVALGAILPPPGEDDTYLKQITKKIPAGQPGNPEVVADAMLALLDNDYVTGETIRVDGGAHLV